MTGSDLCLNGMEMNSYHASVIADYIRHKLLERGASFTFETVMSDRSKVDFICKARAAGYRTYLYFVATETPKSTSIGSRFGCPKTAMTLRRKGARALSPQLGFAA